MNKFKKNYFVDAAATLDKTPQEYIKDAKYNYVILDEGKEPFCWGDGSPVVYGSKAEAQEEFISGDLIISEQEFLRRFCKEEYNKYKN